jgi:hypothetical protein
MNAMHFKSGAAFRLWLTTHRETEKSSVRSRRTKTNVEKKNRGALHSAPRIDLGCVARAPSGSAALSDDGVGNEDDKANADGVGHELTGLVARQKRIVNDVGIDRSDPGESHLAHSADFARRHR